MTNTPRLIAYSANRLLGRRAAVKQDRLDGMDTVIATYTNMNQSITVLVFCRCGMCLILRVLTVFVFFISNSKLYVFALQQPSVMAGKLLAIAKRIWVNRLKRAICCYSLHSTWSVIILTSRSRSLSYLCVCENWPIAVSMTTTMMKETMKTITTTRFNSFRPFIC